MKNILAIDTATKLLAIALSNGTEIFDTVVDEGFKHSEKLLPEIEQVLIRSNISINNIDLLICTRGPGSFTGLRIGMATLKGISTALNIPMVSIPTLDLYAYPNNDFNGIVLPIIDARKKSFYTSVFRNGAKMTSDLDLSKDDIIELIKDEENVLLTGPDANIFYEKVKDNNKFILDTNLNSEYIKNLIPLGLNMFKKNGPDDRDQGPLYIRKSEAEIHLENKNV